MKILTFILSVIIFIAFVFIIYKAIKVIVNAIKTMFNNDRDIETEIEYNLDIYDDATKEQAIKDKELLEDYKQKISKNVLLLEDSIDQLKEAIDEYSSENNNSEFYDDENYLNHPISLDNENVLLHYTDAKGETTNREVDVKEFDGVYLRGYCHLRGRYRAFKINRIKEIFSGSTGEEIKIEKLAEFFKLKYQESPLAKIDKLFNSYLDVLKVIMYIVKADGRYTAKEKMEVRNIIRELSKDDDTTDAQVDKLMSWVEIPSLHSFKISVGKVIKNNSEAIDLIEIAKKITSSKRKLHPQEVFVLEYIKNRINAEKTNEL